MSKQAIVIYGPPGSGKGTQAELLARRYNFVHFDTGRYIESVVHDPKLQKNPIIRRERKLFDSGILCTPSWVLKIVRDAVEKIAKAGYGVIFSGSPRTIFEALGDKKNMGLVKTLLRIYGKKNITILKLQVRDKTSIKRNSHRLVCSVCGLPILSHAKVKRCAFCDGAMRTRSLDKPSVIKVRLIEYRKRTYPIIAEANKIGIKVKELNGEPLPYKVFANLVRFLKLD